MLTVTSVFCKCYECVTKVVANCESMEWCWLASVDRFRLLTNMSVKIWTSCHLNQMKLSRLFHLMTQRNR